MEEETLFGVLQAANYLDTRELFRLCCKAVALKVDSFSTPDQIKELFTIQEPLTEEEITRMRQEHPWIDQPTQVEGV